MTQTSPGCAEPSPATNRRLMPVRARVIVMVMSSMAGVLLSIFIEDSDVKRDYKISIRHFEIVSTLLEAVAEKDF